MTAAYQMQEQSSSTLEAGAQLCWGPWACMINIGQMRCDALTSASMEHKIHDVVSWSIVVRSTTLFFVRAIITLGCIEDSNN